MHVRITTVAILAVLGTFAFGQDLKVEKYRLPNGMTVILHEDHTVPVATIDTWMYVGSKDEPERRSGFAHLFEHLMFMGTKRVPQGQFDKTMESAGGSNNASTVEDRTNYYSVGPSNLLPKLLWLDADRLEALGNNIDQKKLDLQRDVVKNERRENTENTPYGRAFEAINGLMFPPGHPYHTSVIGSMEDLSAATVQDVQSFFSTFYVPNNASLVVAGDFDTAKIKPLIADLFGTLPRQNDPPRKPVPSIPPLGIKRTTMVDKVQQARTIMVWHSPAAYRPGSAEMNLTASVLSDGVSSRLYSDLVNDKKLATEVEAFQEDRLLGSLFYVMATAAEGVSLDSLETEVDRVLKQYMSKGPSGEELKRQSSKLEYQMLSGLQSIQDKADKLNEFEFYLGEPNSFQHVLDTYRNATPGDVRSWASKTLDPENRLILRVIPESEAPQSTARDSEPAVGTTKAFVPPIPDETTLANGSKLFYFQRSDLPLMSLSALFKVGADYDEAPRAGATSLMTDLLGEGAGNRGSEQFERDLDLLGATFGANADHEDTTVSLNVLARNFDKALPLFADALMRPRFDPDAFERVQRVTAANLQQANDDPDEVARKVALREFYGWTNPVGRPVSGTEESVKKLTVDDVKRAYSRTVRPDEVSFLAAGSLPKDQVIALLNREFSAWKPVGTPPVRPSYAPPLGKGLRVVVVDRPDAVQTAIRFVMPGTTYSDPNRSALTALGTVLGGMFTSRLNNNLREDKGYTYGAGSRFVFSPSYGYVSASADVRTDVTGASLREFLKEFKRIRGGDVSSEEASKAALSRRTEFIESLSTVQGLVNSAEQQVANGLPASSIGKEMESMANVGASQINKLANPSLALEKGLLVLVGDKKAILPQLKGLGLPEPVVVKP